MDLAIDNEALDRLMAELPDEQIFPISGATKQGVDSLFETLWQIIQEDKTNEAEAVTSHANPTNPAPGGLNLPSE